jgi:hypothetical protein
MATTRKRHGDETKSAPEDDRHAIALSPEETARFDAAILGADNWHPNETLLRAVQEHKKAVAEGRIKAK